MPDKGKLYQELMELQREVTLVNSLQWLLEWDERTYMPPHASAWRADQMAFTAGLSHEKSTDKRIGGLLSELEDLGVGGDGLSVEDVNVREWRRDYDLAMKLPRELVTELSRTAVHAQHAWREARAAKDFSPFEPWLAKMLALKRREADCYGWTNEPYDALLDQYEPGAETETVARVLNDLRGELLPLLAAIAEAPKKPDTSIIQRHFPVEKQQKFAREVASVIGYSFDSGSLDVTAHPFCTTLGPYDTRITTRFIKDFFNAAFFGVIHEAGHGIYEQNLPKEHWGTPMCDAVSLGIHESQSRMWENFVGRSASFWEFWYPHAQNLFPNLRDVAMGDFVFAVNDVRPSFIRVEADEMTYNLHILLRFELEREMLSGNLKAGDLPGAWNERFREYFGIEVPDDAAGCLQDIHWSSGLIGYFPTYSLGNLNAAQIFETAGKQVGDLDEMFRRGAFTPLREWLTAKVHSQGRRYKSNKLVEVVTGKPMDAGALTTYLKKKFSALYEIEL